MPLSERREVVDTPDGKRIKITRTEERLLDETEVEYTIANLSDRIARLEAELAEAKAARDDLVSKQPQLR